MEAKNKTDQFFREKLDQITFQPSEQAWEKVRGSITSKPTSWSLYLKIAAGFALILGIGVVIYTQRGVNHATISEVTDPQPLELATLEVKKLDQIEKTEPFKNSIATTEVNQKKEKINTATDEHVQVPRETIVLAKINEVAISSEKLATEKLELNEPARQPAVKITYFTGRVNEDPETANNGQDTAKVNLFDKMKFFAKNVSPVELLTDLRTAKEEFIENGFKRN